MTDPEHNFLDHFKIRTWITAESTATVRHLRRHRCRHRCRHTLALARLGWFRARLGWFRARLWWFNTLAWLGFDALARLGFNALARLGRFNALVRNLGRLQWLRALNRLGARGCDGGSSGSTASVCEWECESSKNVRLVDDCFATSYHNLRQEQKKSKDWLINIQATTHRSLSVSSGFINKTESLLSASSDFASPTWDAAIAKRKRRWTSFMLQVEEDWFYEHVGFELCEEI